MFKSTDIKVNPALRIMPVFSVEAMSDPMQLLDSESAKLALKQRLPLPSLTLILDSKDSVKNNTSSASFSPTATLIDNVLKHANAEGVSTKFEAQAVITSALKSPEVIAQDLKNAISNSGLFYESHLSHYTAGARSLAEIKQEPQNLSNSTANNLLPQQLSILENQRLAWHGEVWPGQKMDWDIYFKNEQETGNHYQDDDSQNVIATDLTLYLPQLGKVTARLSLVAGRMRISLLAEEVQTLSVLKEQSKSLVDAIEKNGQILEELKVATHA